MAKEFAFATQNQMQAVYLKQGTAWDHDIFEPSLSTAREMLKDNSIEEIQNEKLYNFLTYMRKVDGRYGTSYSPILKMGSQVLLLDRITKKLDLEGIETSNVIVYDERYFDNIKKAVTYALDHHENMNIVYKHIGHNTLIAYRHKAEEDKNFFYIIDSIGSGEGGARQQVADTESWISRHILNQGAGDNSYVISSDVQRQKDGNTCSIFIGKDLKAISRNPALLTEMEEACGSLMTVTEQDSISEKFSPLKPNYFSNFPEELCKMAQFSTFHLSDYAKKGKDGYGVKSPQPGKGSGFFAEPPQNFTSKYFLAKYLNKTLPEIMEGFVDASEIINIFDQYDFDVKVLAETPEVVTQ